MASCLVGEEEVDSAFSAAVVQDGIALSDQTAVGETLQNRVGGRFIGIAELVGVGVVSTGCLDVQEFIQLLFFFISKL